MAPPPSGAGALVGTRLGKYEVLALIALGGTAEIYLARIGGEAGFEKYVVVKVLHDHLADDQEFVRMFLDEARLGAQLEHSNIVQTLELGQEHGRYFMVMEYLAGMSMAMVARKAQQRAPGGKIPIELVLGLSAQACAGLHYMHQKTGVDGRPLNMVHRDISPQNLVVSFEGMLKIVDFGIAKARVRETHTKSGTIKGKFAYMSPEQCLAQQVDRRTDIFAMGTLIHELLTGRRLFKRESTYETYQAIIAGKVSPPSATNHELDPALDEVVMRSLAYKKEDRYQTAEQLGQALIGLLHRRGKSVSAGEVARFFDTYFDQEIQEHGQRMRELIEGRRQAIEDYTWDSPDLESDAAAQMPDEGPMMGHGAMAGSDDEPEGEATRIELNPLLSVQAMHEEQMAHGNAPRAMTPAPGAEATKIQRSKRTGQTPAPSVGGRTMGYGSNAMSPPSASAYPRAPSAPASPSPSRPSAPAGNRPATSSPNERTLFGAAAPKLPQSPNVTASPGPGGKHGAAPARTSTRQAQGGVPMPLQAAPSAPSPAPHVHAGAEDKTITPDQLPFGQQMSPADIRAAAQSVASNLPPPAQQQGPGHPSGYPGGQPGGPLPPGPNLPPHGAPQGKAAGPEQAFPEIRTPTAFQVRAAPVQTPAGMPAPAGDLALLANERASKQTNPTIILVVAFLVSAGIGLGITVLIGKLVG